MRRALSFLSVIALSACAGGMHQASQIPPLASSSRTTETTASFASVNWIVGTGASTASYAIQDLDFYPSTITIDANDTVSYSVASGVGGDAHTVAFVPAGQTIPSPGDPNNLVPSGGNIVDGSKFVNSGILLGGQVFRLHFPKPGTYRILCLFHEPAMIGSVVVQKAGAPYPHTMDFYAHVSATDRWEDFGAAQLSAASFPFANNGTTFAAGIDPGLTARPPADSTILRYLNSNSTTPSVLAVEGSKTIKVGTVLTWVNETSNEPHTVTFALAGQNEIPNIPPDPAINVVAPPGITTYDGTKIINSGSLIGGVPGIDRISIRFTKPGKFFYGCVYHDNSRMYGWITVTP